MRAIQHLHQGENLRAHHRPAGPLRNTHRHQHLRAGGQSAAGRRSAKRQQAADKQPPVAIQIAEPTAGEQQNGEKEQVAGDHPFNLPRAGEQIPLYHRDGDINDRDVDDLQHQRYRNHQRGQRALPLAGIGRRLNRGRRSVIEHDVPSGLVKNLLNNVDNL